MREVIEMYIACLVLLGLILLPVSIPFAIGYLIAGPFLGAILAFAAFVVYMAMSNGDEDCEKEYD